MIDSKMQLINAEAALEKTRATRDVEEENGSEKLSVKTIWLHRWLLMRRLENMCKIAI